MKGGRKYRQKLVSSLISNITTTGDFSLKSPFSLNCQSVKSKVTRGIITDLIAEHDIDIFALTETWLAGNESDDYILSALTPPGYDIYNVPRGSGDAHGGIIVLFKKASRLFQNQTTEIVILRALNLVTLYLPVDQMF